MVRHYALLKATNRDRLSRVDWAFALDLRRGEGDVEIEIEGRRIAKVNRWLYLEVEKLSEPVAMQQIAMQSVPTRDDLPRIALPRKR